MWSPRAVSLTLASALMLAPVAAVYCNDLSLAARSCCEQSAGCDRSSASAAASDDCCQRSPAAKDKAESPAKPLKPLRSLAAAVDGITAAKPDAAVPFVRLSPLRTESVAVDPSPPPLSILRL